MDALKKKLKKGNVRFIAARVSRSLIKQDALLKTIDIII